MTKKKEKIMQKKKNTNKEEKGMKNSCLYRVLGVGWELKKTKTK